MGEVDYKIIITCVLALTLIELILIIFDHDTIATTSAVMAAVAGFGGLLIKNPFSIDNKAGVLKW